MPSLKIDNFAKGWMTNAALDADKIYSFLKFTNTYVDYERGAAVRRPGYNRHHATALTGIPKQFYTFTNLAGNSRELVVAYDDSAPAHYHLFVLSGGTAYEIRNYSTSPTTALEFDTYDEYPFITVDNRVFFADDNDWYWSDYASLIKGAGPYTYECYQAGIDKPTFSHGGTSENRLGHETPWNSTRYFYEDAGGDVLRIAQSFALSRTLVVDAVRIWFVYVDYATGNPEMAGTFIASIYTNDGGSPGTLVTNATGQRTADDMYSVHTADPNFVRIDFSEKVELASGTYWLVTEGDDAYFDWEAGPAGRRCGLGADNTGGYAGGACKEWDGSSWNSVAGSDILFVIGGGLTEDESYKYAFTYYNSTYALESEPLDYDTGNYTGLITPTQTVLFSNLSLSTNDTQVDKVRMYRTKGGGDIYYHLYDVDLSETSFWDCIDDDNLGDILQSGGDSVNAKHLRLADADGNAIVPRYLEVWNGRIWAVGNSANELNFSKLLEEAGALGVAGDSIYDYFPADNKWSLDSTIRAMRKRGENDLVVYTSNNNIHIFRGGDSPLNPPPDLVKQEMFIGDNCIDNRTLCEYRGRHIFVTSNKEIKAFNGTVELEELAEVIGDEVGRIGDKYAAVIYANQYWLGVDVDGDGVLDSMFIYDLSRPRITNWRNYRYYNSAEELLLFYHLYVSADAHLYACPADLDSSDYHVIELDTGYSDDWTTDHDDGNSIKRIIQTQYLVPARRARWARLELMASYSQGTLYGADYFDGGLFGGSETIPTYEILAMGQSGEFVETAISPTSSRDIRGHTTGIGLLAEQCSVLIEDTGVAPDELRAIELFWSFN